MDTLSQTIINLINEQIKQHPLDGRTIYSQHNHFTNSLGDKSEITYHSWTTSLGLTFITENKDAYYELDSELISDTVDKLNKLLDSKNSEIWHPQLIKDSHYYQWKTISHDFIRLQFSEHGIHLIIFYSGQY